MKWVCFLMHLLHRLVLVIKTQNDIIDLTFDNFYEKHRHRQTMTVDDFACEYIDLTSFAPKMNVTQMMGENLIIFYCFEM